MIMSSNQQPTYAFADDAPVTNARRGKQRRARGFGIGRSKNSNKSSSSSNAASSASSEQSSYRQGGHQLSSSAARAQGAQSMSSQNSNTSNGSSSSSGQKMTLNLNRRPQYSTEGWNDPPARHGSAGSGNAEDQNSCAGSLTYSASSSVQSAESSNDSSFADMIKLIDSEGEAATEIKDFIAKNSKSASSFGAGGSSDPGAGSFLHGKGGGEQYVSSAAVHLYKQRMEDRSREQRVAQAHMAQAKKKKQNLNAKQLQQQAQQQQQEQQQQQQHQFSMGAGKYHPNPNVDLNYSKDDSSEEDPFGATVDFDERVLETIGGLDRSDDDIPTRHTVTVTSQSPKSRGPQAADPFRHQDPFHPSSPYNSAPSSPRSGNNNGHVTPPPNSRQKRTSTPPGSASTVSRTSSRHSKSSSDGSFDTPAPASPPHSSSSSQGTKGSKPPHGARTPVNKARRKSPREDGKNSLALEDPSEAFYAKSWMCGFTDAFNFDGFDKNI